MPADAISDVTCAARLEVLALPGLPVVGPGDDLALLVTASLARAELTLRDGDVIVLASKLVSRAEGRFVDLGAVDASRRAHQLASRTGHDPRHVEVILREAVDVSRAVPGVLVVRHRLGLVVANAGVDFSNASPPAAPASRGRGPWALLLPVDPDASAARLRDALARGDGEGPTPSIGVIISDSFGRPFRLGTVGVAVGCAGLPALHDHRGRRDLAGRPLDHTITALADQIAAAADLVAGQADEGRGALLVRGLRFPAPDGGAAAIVRPIDQDLYA
jgi:coenzyme F420-0:L-glutamate ligase/coenzyme F420-1:gamma-L-glutamate ligase